MTALTKTQIKAAQRKAIQLDEGIKQCVLQTRRMWPAMAAMLYEFAEDRCWEILDYSSLEAYLSDPEVEIERRTFFRLTRAHRVLALNHGIEAERLAELPPSRVHEIVPAVESGDLEVEDALSKASGLAVSDLRIAVKDPNAPIDGSKEKRSCPTCGTRVAPERLES